MDCPDGMNHEEDECLLLVKTIYGLVQLARAFHMTAKKALEKCGFKQSIVDPCLFVRRKGSKGAYIAMWVDDCLFVGDQELVKQSIKAFGKYFKLKIEESIADYLSCEIVYNKEKGKLWIGQPHQVKKLEKEFGDMLPGGTYKTPGTPHQGLVFGDQEGPTIDPERASKYHTGVGMLLYLVKYTRPDIANAVRELTKGMSKPHKAAWKELLRVIKFVLDTKELGLKYQPTSIKLEEFWDIILFSDSDWAGDEDTRRSVTGYAIFFIGMPDLLEI